MQNVMTALNTANPTVTMTSLELVEFINANRKEGEAVLAHSDFMKKVPKVLGTGGLGNFSDTYLHPQNGQQYPCYSFPKREACLMAMSYSYELQAKVWDRMTELEEQVGKPQLPQTYLQALKELVAVTELAEQQALKIEADKPKVDYAEAVESSKDAVLIGTFAKHLGVTGMGQNKMFAWLRDNSFLISDGERKNIPLQKYINNGYFEVKQSVVNEGDKLRFTPLITGKGQLAVAKKLGVKGYKPLCPTA